MSALHIYGDGERYHEIAAFGEPFTPADVTGWMAPHLAGCRAVVCGAQWRDDFPPETLRALAGDGRIVLLDGQGPTRPQRLGPILDEGPLDPAWVEGVTVLKCSEFEADALFGDRDPADSGVPVVVITRGHVGADVVQPGHRVHVEVEPVLGLADTIGAGDTFLALMAAALQDGADPVASCRRGLRRGRQPCCDGAWRSAAIVAASSRSQHARRPHGEPAVGGAVDLLGRGHVAGADRLDPHDDAHAGRRPG